MVWPLSILCTSRKIGLVGSVGEVGHDGQESSRAMIGLCGISTVTLGPGKEFRGHGDGMPGDICGTVTVGGGTYAWTQWVREATITSDDAEYVKKRWSCS